MNAVEIKGLNKSFGKRTIIRDFDLTVRQGEFIALMGSESAKLNITPRTVEMPLRTILSNSFGFGGTNSALVIQKLDF